MDQNTNQDQNPLLKSIREARKAAQGQTNKASDTLENSNQSAKKANPLLKFMDNAKNASKTVSQPAIFSNPESDGTTDSGNISIPMAGPKENVLAPKTNVPMPGTVGKSLSEFKPALPTSDIPSENPSYRILGDRDLNREETMQMIGRAQSIQDLERLQVNNDPEVMEGFQRKFDQLKSMSSNPVQEQAQAPIDKPWWEDVWDGIKSGSRSALSALYEGSGEVADYIGTGGPMNASSIGQYNMIKQMQAKGFRGAGFGAGLREMADTQSKKAENINKQSDTESIGFFVGQMMPYIAGSAAAIATAPISAPAAAAIGSANVGALALASFGSGLQSYDQYKAEKGTEVDPYARLGVGLLYGGAEFAMERISLNKLMPKQFKGKIASAMFGGVPGEVMEKEAKQLVEEFANSSSSRRALVDGVLKDTGKGVVVEGSTEAATEIAQEFTNWLYYEKEDRGNWEELAKNTATAFAGGALMGAGLGPLSYGSQKLVNSKRREQTGKVVIAQNANTGEAVEIVGISGQKSKSGKKKTDSGSVEGTIGGEMIYDVIRPNGRVAQLSEEEVGEVIELPTDVFKGLLNGGIDGQTAIESRINGESQQNQLSQAEQFKADHEGMTYNDPINGQMIAMGKKNGRPVFIKTPTPTGYVIRDDAGNESMVPKEHITDLVQMQFNDFLAQNAPAEQVPYDPSNPIQVGEPINYEGENWVVTGIDTETGTVQLESEDADGVFETIPSDLFQQLRKPKEELLAENTADLNETGAGRLRNMFAAGDQVELETKPTKKDQEHSSPFQIQQTLDNVASKLGIPRIKTGDFHFSKVDSEARKWLIDNLGDKGEDIADIMEFPEAAKRLLDKITPADAKQPKSPSVPAEPVGNKQGEVEQPSSKNAQQESVDQGTDSEVQVGEKPISLFGVPVTREQKDSFSKWISDSDIQLRGKTREEQKSLVLQWQNETNQPTTTTNELQQAEQNEQAGQENVQAKENQEVSTQKGEGQEGLEETRVDQAEIDRVNKDSNWDDVKNASTADDLASLYDSEVQNMEGVDPIDAAISRVITQINPDSFARYGDRNTLSKQIAGNWLAKKGSGQSIDTLAQEASSLYTDGASEDYISPNDVIEFMHNFSSVDNLTQPSGNSKLKDIADKYKAITGKAINRSSAESISKKLKGKSLNKDDKGQLLESDDQIADYLANNPEIISFLDSNFGEDGEVNPQIALEKLESDPSWFTVFPGGFKENEVDAIRRILTNQINDTANTSTNSTVQTDPAIDGENQSANDNTGSEGETEPTSAGASRIGDGQKPDSPDPKQTGEPKSNRGKSVGSDSSKSSLSKKEQKLTDELKDLWGQFGSGGKLRSGVSGEDFEIAGKIIAKSAELGLVKFEQIINWVGENLGPDMLKDKFNSFKAAYAAQLIFNNPQNEDLNSIGKMEVENFLQKNADEKTPQDEGVQKKSKPKYPWESEQLIAGKPNNLTEFKKEDVVQSVYSGNIYKFDKYKPDGISVLINLETGSKEVFNSANNPHFIKYEGVLPSKEETKPVEEESEPVQQLDLFGNPVPINNEKSKPRKNLKTLEDQAKSSESKVKSIKDRESASKQLEKIDGLLSDVEEELKLAGYYNSPKADSHENPYYEHAKLFQKDLVKYSKELGKALGWQHDTDKKGKPVYANANIATAGGDGTIILWAPNSEYGVYLSVRVDPDYTKENDPLKIDGQTRNWLGDGDNAILWRITSKDEKYTGYANQYADGKTTIGQFKTLIEKAVKPYLAKESSPLTLDDMVKAGEGRIQVLKPEVPKADPVPSKPKKKKPIDYRELENLLGDIDNKPFGWHETSGILDEDAFMRFSVEKQQLYPGEKLTKPDLEYDYTGAYKLILEQNYTQNGDLMNDPRIDLMVIPSEGLIFPLNFEQHGFPHIYQEYIQDGRITDIKGLRSTRQFVFKTWIPNLLSQGRAINPNADLNYGKQGQRGDGQVRPTSGKSNEGTQTSTVRTDEGGQSVEAIPTREAGTNESTGKNTKGTGIRPDNSRGTGVSTTDGNNRGQRESDLEKRAKQQEKNRDNYVIPEGFLYPDTFRIAERFDSNIKAMELLVDLIEEDRTNITPEERETLFAYSGFGGIPDIAKSTYGYWPSEAMKNRVLKVQELAKRIDPDGNTGVFDSIKSSINTAHYTEPELIRSHYDILSKIGFQGGKVLDPSAGIGNYFGSMPQGIGKNSMLTGVEIDYFTSEIYKRLYPGSKTINKPLEQSGISDNSFDLVISNIPFGDIKIYDPNWKGRKNPIYRIARQRIHNYFVVKMIDSAREGGLISILTSNAVLDTPSNKSIRQYMAENTQFIGAVRLPNSAFKGASGTKVVTDIIFLKKRKAGESFTQNNPFVESIEQSKDDSKFNINEYFIQNPQNVLGSIAGGGQYDAESGYTVNPTESLNESENQFTNLRNRINEVMDKFATEVEYLPVGSEEELIDGKQRQAYAGKDGIRSGNVFEKDGNFYQAIQRNSQDQFEGDQINVFKKYVEPFRSFIGIRNTLNELIDKERFGEKDDVLNPLRKKLKDQYKKFNDSHGRLNEYANVFSSDIDSYQVLALEVLDKKGNVTGLADIFDKRTINVIVRPTSAESPQEAAFISMNEFNRINPRRMVELIGEDWVEKSKGLIFKLPDGTYESRDQYLSGNIWDKIQEVEGKQEFSENLEELKKVLPKPLPIELISVPLGARYVDIDVYNQFLGETISRYTEIKYLEGSDSYRVSDGTRNSEYSTGRITTKDVIEKAFSDQTIRISDTIRHSDGSTTTQFNPVETAAANAVVDKLKGKWKDWLSQHHDIGTNIAKTYNRLFNSTVKRKFDASHLTFPGLRGITLRDHQASAINMIVQNNGGVVDHIVGAGKTFVMVSGSMELKRLGVAKKPMIIGKKSTIPQIAESFKMAYPGAKVLAPTENDFSASRRKKILSQIAVNDWDVIILSHDNFGQITADPETASMVMQEEVDILELTIEELKGDRSQMSRREIKGLEKRIDNLKAQMQELADLKKDAEIMDFGKLGIDHIMVDESQSFKNLTYSTVHNNVAGLGTKEGAKKTFNLLMAIRYMQKIHKGDKGTTFLSGTPISNTMAELYLILKYLRPTKLRETGLLTFDSWAKTFAEKSSELEFGVSGSLKAKERFRRFINVPELSALYTEIADVRNDSNLKLPKPGFKGGKEDFVLVKPSRNLEKFYKKLIHYASTGDGSVMNIPGFDYDSDAAKKAKMLKVTDLATKASIDLRLVYPQAPFDPQSKLALVAADVAQKYKETNKHKGVSLIFMDSGKTSQYNVGFNGENEIKRILVEEFGIKADQIQLMVNHKTDKKKKVLFPKVNKGEVRILIGSTETMGTGVNVQERVVSMHHVDIPWRPSDYEQRNGRGLRQGNLIAEEFFNNEVDVKVYGVERSLDAYKFELLSIKQSFIDQLKNGATSDRIVDEGDGDEENGASFSDFMAAATGNPIIKEKAKNDKLIDQLSTSRSAFYSSQGRAKSTIEYAKRSIMEMEAKNREYLKILELAEKDNIPEEYPILVKNKSFEKVGEAGEAILGVKPYSKEKIQIMKRGGDELVPQATVGRWEYYIYNAQTFDGNIIKRVFIATTDDSGRKISVHDDDLSDNAVYAANALRTYINNAKKQRVLNQQFIKSDKEKIEQSEKVLQDTWKDEAKYEQALVDQQRIAAEVEIMNKEAGEKNANDKDVSTPMFEDGNKPDPDGPRFLKKPESLMDIVNEPVSMRATINPVDQKATKDQVQKWTNEITETFNSYPEIQIFETQKELIKAFPELKDYENELAEVPGLMIRNPNTGKSNVILVSSHSYLNNKHGVETTLIHEIVGHYGVREGLRRLAKGNQKVYDTKYSEMMSMVADAKSNDPMFVDIASRYFGKPVGLLSEAERITVGDEFIAHLAQSGIKDSLLDRVIAKFREILRSIKVNIKMSDSEIRNIIGNSMRLVQSENGPVVRDRIDTQSVPSKLIIGQSGANSLDQSQEATYRIDNLVTAREMETAGKEPREIKIATGWERGADKKWRYEVGDGKLKVDRRKYASLGDILDHPELFKAYPHLKNMDVAFDIDSENQNEGQYRPYVNREQEGLFDIQEEISVYATDLQNGLSILLHEVQHAIQHKEGFAVGGNPIQFRSYDGEINDIAGDAHSEYMNLDRSVRSEIKGKWAELDLPRRSTFGRFKVDHANMDEIFTMLEQLEVIQDFSDNPIFVELENQLLAKLGQANLKDEAYSKYRKLAGEVESRNVEARMPYSEKDRRNTLLSATEDVAREDQIFLFESNSSSSVNDQTDSPAFKKWFGDSKVVDENGKPLVVFHGTDKKFTTFRKGGAVGWGEGMYFTDNKENASEFGENVMGVYLKIENPIDGNNLGKYEKDVTSHKLWKEEEIRLQKKYNDSEYELDFNELVSEEFGLVNKILRDMGYDGIIANNSNSIQGKEIVVFEPTQIKSATGNNGQFSPTNPDIRFMKVSDNGLPESSKKAITEQAKQSWKDLTIERFQDSMIASKRLIQDKTKGDVKDKADFYTKENLSKGRALVQSEQFVSDYWNPFLKTAKQIVKGYDLSQSDISDYLRAKHHAERKNFFINKEQEVFYRRMQAKYDMDPDLQEKYTPQDWADKMDADFVKKIEKYGDTWPTGMTDEWAERTVSNFEGTVDGKLVDSLQKQVRAMSNFVNNKRYSSGLISRDTYLTLRKQYRNYVPLRDWAGMEGMNENVYSPLMSAKGRTSESADPIPFLFTAAQEAIMRGENNLVRQSALDFVKEHVSPGAYFIRNAWYVKTGEQDEFGNDLWQETMSRPTKAMIDSGDAMRSFNQDVHRVVMQQGDKKNVLPVLVKGNRVFIEFKDPSIPMALKNMNQEKVPGWLSAIRKYTRWLSSMYTQYSPEFGARNLIRDMGFAGFNISTDEGLATAAKTYAKVGKSMKTLWQYFWNDNKYPAGKDGLYLKEFMNEGALTGYSDLKEVKDIFTEAKREIDGLNAKGWAGVKNVTNVGITKVLKPIDSYNRTFENAMRFSYYKTLRDQGVSPQKAAIKAKNLTVNFNRKGTWSSGLGSIYIFFNASVQGTQTLYSKFSDPKTRAKAFGYAGSIMAMGLIQSIMLGLSSDDDEDGKSYYEKIPDHVRRNNIIFPLPGQGEYFKIPLPYGINFFYAMGESLGRTITGQGKAGNEALGVLSVASNAFSPLGGYDFTSDKNRPFQGVAQMFTPSALQPVTDLMINQNFAGFPIYRENFTPSQYQRPDSQMYFEGVNPAIKSVTNALNTATGGDKVKPGIIDINPEWIEYGFEQYFGGPVQFGQNLWATGATLIQGENILKDPYYRKVPLYRSFWQKTGTEYQIRQDYYSNYNEVQALKQAFDLYKQDGDIELAKQLRADEKAKFEMINVAKTINGQISKINDQIGVMKERDETKENNEKLDQLYDKRNEIMLKFNTLYNEKVNPKSKEKAESLMDLFK